MRRKTDQQIEVLPQTEPETMEINWRVWERAGSPLRSAITGKPLKDKLGEGMEVICPGLFGEFTAKVKMSSMSDLYCEDSSNLHFIEWDEKHQEWIVFGSAAKRTVEAVKNADKVKVKDENEIYKENRENN